MVDISIIIVSWNAKSFLDACLLSIYKYTKDVSFEIIVVDNNSADGSQQMIQDSYPNVRLIQTGHNLGFAKGNNIGIKESKGKYLCLVNSDIELVDNSIFDLYSFMNTNPDIGMIAPRIINPDHTLQRSFKRFPTLWNSFSRALALDSVFPKSKLFGSSLMTYFKGDKTEDIDILIGAFWMVRKSALEKVDYLDESFFMYSEDKDWCKRFHLHGWRVVYYSETEVIHFGGGSSSNAPKRFYNEQQKANMQYWKKYHSVPSRFIFWHVLMLHNLFRIFGFSLLFILKKSLKKNTTSKIKTYLSGLYWLITKGFKYL